MVNTMFSPSVFWNANLTLGHRDPGATVRGCGEQGRGHLGQRLEVGIKSPILEVGGKHAIHLDTSKVWWLNSNKKS